jgi:hypothetical protein
MLIDQAIQCQNKIVRYKTDRDFWWDIFHKEGGITNYNNLLESENKLTYWEDMYKNICEQYDLKKTSSNLVYGLTIGSSEKNNTDPCLYLWHRFSNSADGKRLIQKEAYFERGENGYIHIHAYLKKEHKFSMSINKLRKRYGTYKGKQHNFDLVRLKGIDQVKWQNYIKKDSKKSWNLNVNSLISLNSATTQEL